MITFVIGNGPSNIRWRGIKMHPSIGCNYGIKDFDLDHLVCVDRMAVHAVRQLPTNANTKYWCKRSPLELPPGWNHCDPAGIDSGSMALKLASTLYPDNEIIVIGFDGVLGYTNDNAYEYDFRQGYKTKEHTRLQHRQAVIDLLPDLPTTKFVGYTKDQELEVINYDEALAKAITQSRSVS